MKWLQNGNLAKMVAFFVIATVITCTVSFAANGWQSFTTDPDSDNIVTDNIYVSDNVDENKDGDSENQDIPVVAPQTKYYHYWLLLLLHLYIRIFYPLVVELIHHNDIECHPFLLTQIQLEFLNIQMFHLFVLIEEDYVQHWKIAYDLY